VTARPTDGPVVLRDDLGDPAREILGFIRDVIGRRRDDEGHIGVFCRFIRPALRNDAIRFDECLDADEEAARRAFAEAIASSRLTETDPREYALILAFPSVDASETIDVLYRLRQEFIGTLADAGMTGALVFRRGAPGAVDGRVGVAPATPFWVLRFLLPEDEALSRSDPRTSAAWAARYR
jgi:hypothetical protein